MTHVASCLALAARPRAACSSRARASGAEGAALRLPDCRDRLRPGADLRPVFAHRGGQHLRGAADLRLPGAAGASSSRNTAAALPEVSDDFRRFTLRIRPGIYFADDPAFKGSARARRGRLRLFAQAPLRPALKSPKLSLLENARILGLSELRQEGHCRQAAFDYDTEVEGLRALDRYTFEVRLAAPAPRFLYDCSRRRCMGAVAREVVEATATSHGASGGHRAVPARRVAAQLADRARAQPELPRRCSTTKSAATATRRAGHRGQPARAASCRWSTASRSASSRRRSRAGWLS